MSILSRLYKTDSQTYEGISYPALASDYLYRLVNGGPLNISSVAYTALLKEYRIRSFSVSDISRFEKAIDDRFVFE